MPRTAARAAAGTVLAMLAATTMTSCSDGDRSGSATDPTATLVSATPSLGQPRDVPFDQVVLLGDSLAQEIAPNVTFLLSPTPVVPKFYGGTAPCDWLDDDLGATAGGVVVITFTGNHGTSCMRDPAGAELRGDALVDRFRTDVTTLAERARAAGAWVVIVGQPARGDDPLGATEVDGLNRVYRTLAEVPGITFVDAGATVENVDGSFATRLPCSSIESQCDADGTVAVRSDDGVHLCPGEHEQPCPVYSSGALRFALAIIEALEHPERFDP